MKFSKFDMRMFNEAKKEALKSDYKRFHVGCVMTYKHTVIGRGRNSAKSNPMQKKYNRKYRKFNNKEGQYIHDAVHAEISCLNSTPYAVGKDVDWSKVSVYVFRICPGKPSGMGNSKPCPACMNAIRDFGIKNVFYSDDEGFSYLRLD